MSPPSHCRRRGILPSGYFANDDNETVDANGIMDLQHWAT